MATVLDRAARAFLARHRVARLATADLAGVPHVVPFCYAVAGDRIYFVVDAKPKKRSGLGLKRMRNITENPAVALVADDYDENWDALAFILIRGHAAVVAGARERARALAALRARYPQYRAMRLDGPEHPVVGITPTSVHSWTAAGPRVRPKDDGGPRARRAAIPGRPKSARPRRPRGRH